MSDNKLMPCVCEGEGVIYSKKAQHAYYFVCKKCVCGTPIYTTPEQAAEAWRVMQTALQAGWSSEVPSEDGVYMFYGSVLFEYADSITHFIKEDVQIAKVWAEDNLVYFVGNSTSAFLDFAKGFWYRINYPQPPQDTDNGKD